MTEIPGNDHALAKLRELVAFGKAIAFVGAGASAGLYPLWNQLIHQLAEEAVKRGLAKPEDRDYWLGIADKRPQQAVRGIKEALRENIYAEALRQIFRPKAGDDGNRFTPVHGALLRIPFRGYVTTNYDPGLIEARLTLRPDIGATGYATWKDPDSLQRWYTGDIFQEERCPILFAHGIYERSETMILGVGEYRDAYKAGLYRRLFDKLWGEERLVFVGFGFSDPWLDFLANEVITQTAGQAAGEPRHVALIGLKEEESYTAEMRRTFHDQYNAEVYFYRVVAKEGGGEDHSDLLRILNEIAGPPPKPPSTPPTPRPSPPSAKPPQRWTHETTNDDRYTGREDTLARLDRWADDPAVRVVTVTGMGGLGKTALVGHWLKQAGGDVRRPNKGLFFWSFYADREVDAFLKALLEFAVNDLKLPRPQKEVPPVKAAVAILRQAPLLIVLDGLEVLQERPGTVAYGTLLADDLREFLDAACRSEHAGLIVLTSRFPFVDLNPYLGAGLRALDLDHLTPEEGADLLRRSEVGGTEQERLEISKRYEGHPLALRIFAAAVATQAYGDPSRLINKVFRDTGLRDDDPLEWKLLHLLTFYEEQLSAKQRMLLGLVSLFRTPVEEATVRTLARQLPDTEEVLADMTAQAFHQEFQGLCNDHLLLRDYGDAGEVCYSCHPVLREHFRNALLGRGKTVASGVTDFLTGQPSSEAPKSIREMEPVLSAIELLLEAGDFQRADMLYTERLNNGRIFLTLPALYAGIQCALGFVANTERRRQCEQQLSSRRLSFYLNDVGLFAHNAGELQYGAQFYKESTDIDRRNDDKKNLSTGHRNYSELLINLGQLAEAQTFAQEAVTLARELDDKERVIHGLSFIGNLFTLQGRLHEAIQAFEEANKYEQEYSGNELCSIRGIFWADLLVRLGRVAHARQLTEANLQICQRNNWYDDTARCHWVFGRIDIVEGRLSMANDHLNRAESIMRRGHMLTDLSRVLLAKADLHRRQKAWDEASRYVEETLRLAAPRMLRLVHADALVMQGRIVLERAMANDLQDSEQAKTQMYRAQDDAKAGLVMARQCGYPWAERDALVLLVDACQVLKDEENALKYRREAEVISRRLELPPDAAP